MNLPKSTWKLILIMFLALIVIVGCSNDSNNNASNDDDQTDSEDNEDSGEEETNKKSMLNIALDATPPTLDQPKNAATATRDVSRLIFETLITTDAEFKPQPMLAESYEVSEDSKSYTFQLREGIKFHDGSDMTSEDVIASMKRWLEVTNLSGSIFDGAEWTADGDYTVHLELATPSALTIDTIATSKNAPAIMPKEIVENAPAEGVDEIIGTGPFKLEEWRTDAFIHLTKYDDYQMRDEEPNGLWGRREALVEDIYFHLVPDSSTRLAGLQSGEYDFAYSIPADNYDILQNTDGVEPVLVPGSNTILKLNNVERIASDNEFRKIINTALDYEEIMLAAFASPDFYWLDSSYMHKDVLEWASSAGNENFNINDPEKAKQMLEDYGYDGEEVVIMATRDYEYMYQIGVVVNEQLTNIGINSRLDVYDWPTLDEMESKTAEWDIEVMGISMTSTPPQLLMLSSTWAGGVNDDKITNMLKEIESSTDLDQAHQLWDELQEYAWDYLPIINLGGGNTLYGITDKVEGLEVPLGAVYWNVSVNE